MVCEPGPAPPVLLCRWGSFLDGNRGRLRLLLHRAVVQRHELLRPGRVPVLCADVSHTGRGRLVPGPGLRETVLYRGLTSAGISLIRIPVAATFRSFQALSMQLTILFTSASACVNANSASFSVIVPAVS